MASPFCRRGQTRLGPRTAPRLALAPSPRHPSHQHPPTSLEPWATSTAAHPPRAPTRGPHGVGPPSLRGRAAGGGELSSSLRGPTVPAVPRSQPGSRGKSWATTMRKATWVPALSVGTVLAGWCRHEGLILRDRAALGGQRTGHRCCHQEHAGGTTPTHTVDRQTETPPPQSPIASHWSVREPMPEPHQSCPWKTLRPLAPARWPPQPPRLPLHLYFVHGSDWLSQVTWLYPSCKEVWVE